MATGKMRNNTCYVLMLGVVSMQRLTLRMFGCVDLGVRSPWLGIFGPHACGTRLTDKHASMYGRHKVAHTHIAIAPSLRNKMVAPGLLSRIRPGSPKITAHDDSTLLGTVSSEHTGVKACVGSPNGPRPIALFSPHSKTT